jgi:hypothetical protein
MNKESPFPNARSVKVSQEEPPYRGKIARTSTYWGNTKNDITSLVSISMFNFFTFTPLRKTS